MTNKEFREVIDALTKAKQYNSGVHVQEWSAMIHLPCTLKDKLVDFLGKVRHWEKSRRNPADHR